MRAVAAVRGRTPIRRYTSLMDTRALTPTSFGERLETLTWSESTASNRAVCILSPARANAVPIVLGGALWDAYLVIAYATLLRHMHVPAIYLLLPLVQVGAALTMTWLGLVRLLNVSRIVIDPDHFAVENGPLPVEGARMTTREIARFEAEEPGDRGAFSWVRVVMRSGATQRLPIDARGRAEFVAARLNAVLAAVRVPSAYRG